MKLILSGIKDIITKINSVFKNVIRSTVLNTETIIAAVVIIPIITIVTNVIAKVVLSMTVVTLVILLIRVTYLTNKYDISLKEILIWKSSKYHPMSDTPVGFISGFIVNIINGLMIFVKC